jgi:hypothetical protein
VLLRSIITPALLGGLLMTQASPAAGRAAVSVRARSAGADTVRTQADSIREYHGVYETGFEVSWFHPCDATPGDDTWWVTLTNDALRQRDSLAKGLTGRPRAVLVRWRATVGPKMPAGAGHMGRGSRYMLVTQVLSLSAADNAGCTSA